MTNPATPTQQKRLYCSVCGEARGTEQFTCRKGGRSVPIIGGHIEERFQGASDPCPSPNPSEPKRCGGSPGKPTSNTTDAGDGFTVVTTCPGCPDCNPSEPCPHGCIHGAGQEGELGVDCEYGCSGPCENLDHWKDRASYFHTVSWNQIEARDEAIKRVIDEAEATGQWSAALDLIRTDLIEPLEARAESAEASYSTLRGEVERYRDAFRYIAGFDVAGYDAHMPADEVAQKALSEGEEVKPS